MLTKYNIWKYITPIYNKYLFSKISILNSNYNVQNISIADRVSLKKATLP